MLNAKQLKKTLLATSLVALFSIGSMSSFAEEIEADRSYIDPVTGEVKQAMKLLSEMTDETFPIFRLGLKRPQLELDVLQPSSLKWHVQRL